MFENAGEKLRLLAI